MRRRNQVLDAKYDKSLKQLYCELREPAPEQVDSLTVNRTYAILATSPTCDQVHLEHPPDLRGSSRWSVDGTPTQVLSVEDSVCTLVAAIPFPGQELEQVQTLSSVADLHFEFHELWAPRWQQHASTSAADWQRFLDFATAFLPQHSFDLPDIDESCWRKALRHLKVRAARGPDGWARDDLLRLPSSRTAELLALLQGIELGRQA